MKPRAWILRSFVALLPWLAVYAAAASAARAQAVQHTAAVSRGSGLPRALLQEQAQELLPNYALGLILPEGPILKNSQFDLQLAQAECPDSWDWRTQGLVAAVEDQGQCLSCWAFAAASAMESAAAIAGQPLQPLSEQLLVDCVKEGAYGCRGGWHHSAYLWASQNGAVGDLAHPYTQRDGPICPAMIGMAFPIDGYVDVPRNKDELKTAVCGSPVAVAIHVTPEFQRYTSGIFTGPCSSIPTDANHAVTVVGYGVDEMSGQEYWVIRNSWGVNWGEQGYMRLAKGSNACGVANFAAFPLPTVGGATAPQPTPGPLPDFQPTPGPFPDFQPIPGPTPDSMQWLGSQRAPSGCTARHIVKEGDTIFTIAQEYTVEPQAVMDVNPQIINQDLIFPGDSINIPPCSVVPQRVQLSAACAVNYIIQVGDTLFKLASQFKVPMGSLAAANNITNINFIRAGDVLQVPAACNSTGNSTSSSTPGLPGGRGLAMPNATGPGSMSPL